MCPTTPNQFRCIILKIRHISRQSTHEALIPSAIFIIQHYRINHRFIEAPCRTDCRPARSAIHIPPHEICLPEQRPQSHRRLSKKPTWNQRVRNSGPARHNLKTHPRTSTHSPPSSKSEKSRGTVRSCSRHTARSHDSSARGVKLRCDECH